MVSNFLMVNNLAMSALTLALNIILLAVFFRVWRIVHHSSILLIGIAAGLGILKLLVGLVLQNITSIFGVPSYWIAGSFLSAVYLIVLTVGIIKLLLWIPELLELKALDMSGRPENE